MSKKDINARNASNADTESAGFLDQNWEQRLKEARAQRAKNLSEEGRASRRKSAPQKEERDDNGIGVHLSGAAAAKALFLFAGSAGFALGAVLGIGILIGWGQSDRETAQNMQSILPFGPAQAEAAIPEAEPLEVVAKLDMPVVANDVLAADKADVFDDSVAVDEPMAAQDVAYLDRDAPVVTDTPPLIGVIQSPALAASPQEVARLTLGAPPEDVTLFQDRLINSLPSDIRGLPDVTAEADVFSLEPVAVAQVFIHAPNGVSQSTLQSVSSKVEATGVAVAGVGRETFRVSATHVRYYSPDSAELANALAADLGLTARDFSQNALVPGRIELWVEGQPKKRVAKRSSRNSRKKLFSSSRHRPTASPQAGER